MNAATLHRIRQLCCLGVDSHILIPAVLRDLHEIVPSYANSFHWLDEHQHIVNAYDESPEALQIMASYLADYGQHHGSDPVPTLTEIAQTQPGIITTQRLVGKSFYSTKLYNEFLRPVDHHHSAGAAIRAGDRCLGVLMLHRGKQDMEFIEQEERDLAQIIPYIAHAMQHTQQQDSSSALVASETRGLLILNQHGQLQYACPQAKKLLLLATQPKISPQTVDQCKQLSIPVELKALCFQLLAIFQAENNAIAPPVWRHRNQWGGFTFRTHWLDPKDISGNALIGITVDHYEPLAFKLMRQLERFSLTAKQIEICLLVANGKTYKEISRVMQISVHTVVDHIRKIYTKLGINNHEELTALLTADVYF